MILPHKDMPKTDAAACTAQLGLIKALHSLIGDPVCSISETPGVPGRKEQVLMLTMNWCGHSGLGMLTGKASEVREVGRPVQAHTVEQMIQ